MIVEVEHESGTDFVELWIKQPLPHIPKWIRINLDGTSKTFWTDPDHYFQDSEGLGGDPKLLLDTAKSLVAGEIDANAAHDRFVSALEGWSDLKQSETK